MTGWSEGALFSNSRHSSKRKERRSDVYSWRKFSNAYITQRAFWDPAAMQWMLRIHWCEQAFGAAPA